MEELTCLRFTAIKVRLSPLVARKKPQIVVVSNKTTSHDLVAMVIKKSKMDACKGSLIDLVAEHMSDMTSARQKKFEAETTETLSGEDKPLVIYDNQPKGTIRFSLVWKSEDKSEESRSQLPQETASQMDEEALGSGTRRNGCTLPGKGPAAVRLNSPEERPEGEYLEVTANDCLVHYEPHTGSPAVSERSWARVTNGYGQNTKSSAQSPLEYDLSVVCSSNGSTRTGRSDSALTDEGSASIVGDVYTSLNGSSPSSTCSSFSSSDDRRSNPHSTSLPDMAGLVGTPLRLSTNSNRSTRSLPVTQHRRTLPKLQVSHEDVQQKQHTISAEFCKKLRQFMKTKKVEEEAPSQRHRAPPSELDETMSVTSLEVADILAGAAPPGLSDDEDDEDDVDYDDDEATTVCSDTDTLDGDDDDRSLSPLVDPPPPSKGSNRLSHFVEQSMESFLTTVTGEPKIMVTKGPLDPRQSRFPVTSQLALEQRPVSVFTLIQNYALSDVVLTKVDQEVDSGLVLRDKMVSFQNFRCASGSPDKTQSCILPCISGLSTSEGSRVQGSILKGDLIIEVNGRSAFNMVAKHVTSFIDQSKDVEMVVARKRVYINKTTCTSPRSVAF